MKRLVFFTELDPDKVLTKYGCTKRSLREQRPNPALFVFVFDSVF